MQLKLDSYEARAEAEAEAEAGASDGEGAQSGAQANSFEQLFNDGDLIDPVAIPAMPGIDFKVEDGQRDVDGMDERIRAAEAGAQWEKDLEGLTRSMQTRAADEAPTVIEYDSEGEAQRV